VVVNAWIDPLRRPMNDVERWLMSRRPDDGARERRTVRAF